MGFVGVDHPNAVRAAKLLRGIGMSRFNPQRRAILTATKVEDWGLPPPWTDVSQLAEGCTRCGDCVTACPQKVLVLEAGRLPELNFAQRECTFCGDCATACGEGLFDRNRPFTAKVSIAPSCLTELNVDCQSCADACPSRAIRFRPTLGRVPQPTLILEICTGCGACVAPCPVSAIHIQSRPSP